MDTAQKKAQLSEWLMTAKQIISPADIEAEIQKMASMVSEAIAQEHGLNDVVDKAYYAMNLERGISSPAAQNPAQVTTSGTTSAKSNKKNWTVRAAGTDAELAEITKIAKTQQQSRSQATQTTSLVLILDRPAPEDVFASTDKKGKVKSKSWQKIQDKITSGEYVVCADDEAEDGIKSTTNYQAITAAVTADTPLDVYVGELNTRPIGYEVKKSGSASYEKLTREEACNFVITDTLGFIVTYPDPTYPSVKLRYVAAKSDPEDAGKEIPENTVLVDCNKKAAIENNHYVISKEIVPNETRMQTCKSALRFRVEVPGDLDNNNKPKKKTIRVTLEMNYPTLRRKEGFEMFGLEATDEDKNLQRMPEDPRIIEKYSDTLRNAIARLKRQASTSPDEELQQKMAAFNTTAAVVQQPKL